MLSILACVTAIAGCIASSFSVSLFRQLFIINHNWIIKPNTKVKASSVISAVLLSIVLFINAAFLTLYIWYDRYEYYLAVIVYITDAMTQTGQFTYYLYLFWNIDSEAKQNTIINHSVPRKWIISTRVILIITVIHYPIYQFLYWYLEVGTVYFVFTTVNRIASIFVVLFLDFGLLYIYIRSLHIYGKWWYSKNQKESNQYGLNEREHEILIRISRFCVVCTIAVMIDIVNYCIGIWTDVNWSIELFIPIVIFDGMSNLAHVSAIYFSFEFGHPPYLKCYGKLHEWVYKRSTKAHQKKVQADYIQLSD